MKTEQRTIYISEDGKEFDSEDACVEYEKAKEFSCVVQGYIEKYSDDYYDSDTLMDIAKVIADHFGELIEKYKSL